MKRPAAVFGSICLSLGLSVLASGQTGDFSGKWILNKEKSDSAPRVTQVGRTARPKTPVGRTARPNTPIGRPTGSKTLPKISPGAKSSTGLPPGAKIQGTVPGAIRGSGIGNVYGGVTFDGSTPVADDVPLIITQTAKRMRIENALRVNDINVPNTETYTLDGKKHEKTIQSKSGTELKREVKASLEKNKIKIEVVTLDPQGRKFRTTREFSLSKDGRTLTVELSSQSLKLLSSQKMVYDKN